MRSALGAAVLGVGLTLAAAAFDTASLYVPGIALVLLGTGAAAWVALAAAGAAVERAPAPSTVEEEHPYPLRLLVRGGLLPPQAASWSSRCSAARSPFGRSARAPCAST